MKKPVPSGATTVTYAAACAGVHQAVLAVAAWSPYPPVSPQSVTAIPTIMPGNRGYWSYAHARPVCRYSSTGIGSTPGRMRAV
ncbi:hypothetical protein CK936_29950 [Streptomyces albireticuli]|uniref:Uncharacterized protein n=1 Tax=Streptomyces albireticuli TaxID=1940 RepID=A0A2A2D1Q9_9ACTN|nr:hypothetical protein CK936_29950 [Streptomyces albireticuli]